MSFAKGVPIHTNESYGLNNTSQEFEQHSGEVIALEGPVCSGKSTVLLGLAASGLVNPILEYSEYVDSATADFPKFPPQDDRAAKSAFELFLDLERQRFRDFNQTRGSRILDRSIFTLLAFEAGASRITGIDIMSWAYERLSQTSHEIIWPHHILYFDQPTDVSLVRAKENNIRIPDFQFDIEFNAEFRSFFMQLFERQPGFITIINSSASPLVVQEQVLEALKI